MASRKRSTTKRAAFHRDMYPGVRFCSACFCHHNADACPDWRALNPAINGPVAPGWRYSGDGLGTWIRPPSIAEAA